MPATSPIRRQPRRIKKLKDIADDDDQKENIMMQGSLTLRTQPEDSMKAALESKMMTNLQVQSPTTLHALSPGQVYVGTQSSKNQEYKVSVTIQSHSASRLSGYFTIESLCESYPQLTTCFEGCIIDGDKTSFITGNDDASREMDQLHWSKFESFRALGYNIEHEQQPIDLPERLSQSSHVYMRWKEQFLVPDHSIKVVDGISFSGFYYLVLDVAKQEIEGYYHHQNSELFQHLRLSLQSQRHSFSYGFR